MQTAGKGRIAVATLERRPSGAKQAAEKGLNPGQTDEKHTSGAKARVDSAAFVPGIDVYKRQVQRTHNGWGTADALTLELKML